MRDDLDRPAARVDEVASRLALIVEAVDRTQDGLVVVDGEGRVVVGNGQASMLLGLDERIPVGTPVAALAARLALEGATAALATIAAPAGNHEVAETELMEGFWVRTSRTRTSGGGYVAITTDVTLEREQAVSLGAANRDLDAALANMAQGLCLVDRDGRLRLANARLATILGLAEGAVRPGETLREALGPVAEALADPAPEALATLRGEGPASGAGVVALRDGRSIGVGAAAMADGGRVVTYEDVTARLEGERHVAHAANHDVLTGLPNRKLLGERLASSLGRMDPVKGFSLMYLDLDRFKAVNDGHGHPVGDELLRQVANRLLRCVRERDTVARLGGDEFAIILTGAGREAETEAVAGRVVAAIGRPFRIGDVEVSIGASIGITCAPLDGDAAERLLGNADVALYRAKAEGRGTWRFFEREMDERIQARRALEAELRGAIGRGEFELHYQPRVALAALVAGGDARGGPEGSGPTGVGGVVAVEALLRWRHPRRGLVGPEGFLEVAEETRAIVELGAWALRAACEQAVAWGGATRVGVGVSATQVAAGGFPELVARTLAETGCDPALLELGVAEAALGRRGDATGEALVALARTGVGIAMDDFGTGPASLTDLGRLPFGGVRVAASLVAGVATSPRDERTVRAAVAMARALGLRVAAAGVATVAQLDALRAMGVEEVRGDLVGQAAPAA